jgi:tetratricopeptide (TPR) repeat protein
MPEVEAMDSQPEVKVKSIQKKHEDHGTAFDTLNYRRFRACEKEMEQEVKDTSAKQTTIQMNEMMKQQGGMGGMGMPGGGEMPKPYEMAPHEMKITDESLLPVLPPDLEAMGGKHRGELMNGNPKLTEWQDIGYPKVRGVMKLCLEPGPCFIKPKTGDIATISVKASLMDGTPLPELSTGDTPTQFMIIDVQDDWRQREDKRLKEEEDAAAQAKERRRRKNNPELADVKMEEGVNKYGFAKDMQRWMRKYKLGAMSEALGDLGIKFLTDVVDLEDEDVADLVLQNIHNDDDPELACRFESCVQQLQHDGGIGEEARQLEEDDTPDGGEAAVVAEDAESDEEEVDFEHKYEVGDEVEAMYKDTNDYYKCSILAVRYSKPFLTDLGEKTRVPEYQVRFRDWEELEGVKEEMIRDAGLTDEQIRDWEEGAKTKYDKTNKDQRQWNQGRWDKFVSEWGDLPHHEVSVGIHKAMTQMSEMEKCILVVQPSKAYGSDGLRRSEVSGGNVYTGGHASAAAESKDGDADTDADPYVVPPDTVIKYEVQLLKVVNMVDCCWAEWPDLPDFSKSKGAIDDGRLRVGAGLSECQRHNHDGSVVKRTAIRGRDKEYVAASHPAASLSTVWYWFRLRVVPQGHPSFTDDGNDLMHVNLHSDQKWWATPGSEEAQQPVSGTVVYDSRGPEYIGNDDPEGTGNPTFVDEKGYTRPVVEEHTLLCHILEDNEVEPKGMEAGMLHMFEQETALVMMKSHCGFGKKGRPEWNIPPGVDLEAEVYIHKFVKDQPVYGIPAEDKLPLSEMNKEHGNRAFREGNYTRAIARYEKALGFLQESLIYTFLTIERKQEARERRLPLWNNQAMCYLKLNRWSEARRQVAKVLGCDEEAEENIKRGKLSEDQKTKGMSMHKLPVELKAKALFRRAQAYEGVGEFEKSEADFRAVIDLQPNNKAARAALKNMLKELRSYNKKSAKMGKHVFSRMFDEVHMTEKDKKLEREYQALLKKQSQEKKMYEAKLGMQSQMARSQQNMADHAKEMKKEELEGARIMRNSKVVD